ncbi:MAG: outer membrane protein assembly factor BamB family protein, partial [Planctomycetota bacterium]
MRKRSLLLILLFCLLGLSGRSGAGAPGFHQPAVDVNDARRDGRFNQFYHMMKRNAETGNWKTTFEAFDGLQKAMAAFTREYVLSDEKTPGRFVSARDSVFATVASFPPEAFKEYRNRIDPEAEKLFQTALARNDIDSMTDVVSGFFFSSYGDDALVHAARRAFEAGQYALVLALTGDLFRYYPGSDRELGEMHILAALAAARECDFGRFEAELDEAKKASGKIRFEGKEKDTRLIVEDLFARYGRAQTSISTDTAEKFDFIPGKIRMSCKLPAYYITAGVKNRFTHWGLQYPACILPTASEDGLSLTVQTPLKLVQLDLFYGRLKWSTMLEDIPVNAVSSKDYPYPLNWRNALYAPSISGDTIAVSTRMTIRTYGLKDGKLIWDARAVDGNAEFFKDVLEISSPVIAHGRIYACVTKIGTKPEAFVFCFNAGCKQTVPNGSILWETFCCKTGSPNTCNIGAPATPPAVRAGKVFAVTNAGAVAALDAFSGSINWLSTYPRMTLNLKDEAIEQEKRWAVSAPVIAGGKFICAPCDSAMAFAFDMSNGRREWSIPRLPGLRYLAGPAAGLVAFTGDGALAVNIGSGIVVWHVEGEGNLSWRPVMAEDYTYIPSEKRIRKYNTATGILEREFPVGGGNIVRLGSDLAIAGEKEIRIFMPGKRGAKPERSDPESILATARNARRAGEAALAFTTITKLLEDRRAVIPVDVRNDAMKLACELARNLVKKADDPAWRIELMRAIVQYEQNIPDRIRADFDIAEEMERLGRYKAARTEYDRLAVRHHGFELRLSGNIRIDAGIVAKLRLKMLQGKEPVPYPPPSTPEPEGRFAAPAGVLWRTGTNLVGYGREILEIPGAEDSGLFFVKTMSFLEARERDTGLPLWRIKFRGINPFRASDAPNRTIALGSALYLADAHRIKRINIRSGETVWTKSVLDLLGNGTGPMGETVESICASGDALAVSTGQGDVHLLNSSSGEKLWTGNAKDDQYSPLAGPPIIAGDRIVIFTNYGPATCEAVGFSLRNGAELFRAAPPEELPIRRFNQPPVLMPDGKILAIVGSRYFVVLDAETGKFTPRGDIGKPNYIRYGRDILVARDKIVAFFEESGVSTISVINEDGTESWRKKLKEKEPEKQQPGAQPPNRMRTPQLPPVDRVRKIHTDGERIYVVKQTTNETHKVLAYDIESGGEIWNWPPSNEPQGRIPENICISGDYIITMSYRRLMLGEYEKVLKAVPSPSPIGAVISLIDSKTGETIQKLFIPARVNFQSQAA